MKSKIFKAALCVLIALSAINTPLFAQDSLAKPPKPPKAPKAPKVRTFDGEAFNLDMQGIDLTLKMDMKELEKNLEKLNKIAPQIAMQLKGLDKNFNFKFDNIAPQFDFKFDNIAPKIYLNPEGLENNFDLNFNYDNKTLKNKIESGEVKEKIKNYTKSYPVDANDKLKLSNKYGKITVTTWDKHEVKVDVQIKADANDDDEAQKLLDAVQINDNKTGDIVSFKTEIAQGSNDSWKLFSWNGNKVHKLEINYTVYMPAKTDLDVDNRYGSIILPDMDGKMTIRCAYGAVSAQNLSNMANEIRGSYGSFKVLNLNGGRLNYSYSSVDVAECNNLKADLSYGSFKLGKLTGTADMDLSYVGGFKIKEVANSFKRLNINCSYSGVSLGIPNNNFDFDITTSYGRFNYNDDKVTITSKTPPDGSKHFSMTRNYKGHVGKAGSDAQVFIKTSFGGVHFD